MILTYNEIIERGPVEGANTSNQRMLTSYDATVGNIICDGLDWNRSSFLLKPRNLVWIKSAERFKIPSDLTAVATLKTTWTHKGILALNVGIVDPGWEGPLATVIVNFSKVDFPLKLGDPFFRLVFFDHRATNAKVINKSHEDYLNDVLDHSVRFSNTFLTMDTLSDELSKEIFKAPAWAPKLAFYAIILSLIAIFAPLAYEVYSDGQADKASIGVLKDQMKALCKDSSRC